jgi:DeoR family fructose operon transcriptional repressor
MDFEARKRFILNRLEKEGTVSIQEIAKQCGISDVTARRDLVSIESQGLLSRIHGGAVRTRSADSMFSYDKKALHNRDKKIRISGAAAACIQENDSIYIDCGTTVYHLSRYIKGFSRLSVITNSLPVVSELIFHSGIRIYLLGGELDNERRAMYGPMSENMIRYYRARKAFIGAGGVSLADGLSAGNEREASITRMMAEAADTVYLLCDSSKIEKNAFVHYAPLEMVDYLVTDHMDPELKKAYEKQNINVIIPESNAYDQ